MEKNYVGFIGIAGKQKFLKKFLGTSEYLLKSYNVCSWIPIPEEFKGLDESKMVSSVNNVSDFSKNADEYIEKANQLKEKYGVDNLSDWFVKYIGCRSISDMEFDTYEECLDKNNNKGVVVLSFQSRYGVPSEWLKEMQKRNEGNLKFAMCYFGDYFATDKVAYSAFDDTIILTKNTYDEYKSKNGVEYLKDGSETKSTEVLVINKGLEVEVKDAMIEYLSNAN